MKKIASKNKGIKLIRKSNDLVEARYKFDIWETRVFTKLLTIIRPDDIDFQPFRIYLRDVIDDFKLHKDKASYQLLREATDNLLQKVFYVPYEVENAIRERKYPIIIMSDTMKEAKDEGARVKNEYVEVCIHPEMKPLLLQLKEKFTSYDIENITSLKSNYTLRIYEHLKQYERIGRRQLDIEYLKRIFEITTEYPLFANFYQKVIEPAFHDINHFTDLTITKIGKLKRSRKVESLLFEFHRKAPKDMVKAGQPTVTETEVVEVSTQKDSDTLFLKFQKKVVVDFGVSPTVFLAELQGKTDADIQKAIRVTEETQKTGSIKNLAGFFIQALRRNFTNEIEEKKVKKQKVAEQQERITKLKQEIVTLKEEQTNDIFKRIRELTLAKPEITDEAIHHIKSSPLKSRFIQNLEHTMGKTLTTQDFRDHPDLRHTVIETIYELYQAEFMDITEGYRTHIENRQMELKEL
jgi:plasmid replication initiation protein